MTENGMVIDVSCVMCDSGVGRFLGGGEFERDRNNLWITELGELESGLMYLEES